MSLALCRCDVFYVAGDAADAGLDLCDVCVWGELKQVRQDLDQARACALHMYNCYNALRVPSDDVLTVITAWESND